MSPQLAGPLLPHRHGHSLSSLSPGHERVRGFKWWAALPDTPLGLLQGVGVGGPAAVDGSFSVQVGPPSSTSPGKNKNIHCQWIETHKFILTEQKKKKKIL